MLEMVIRMDDEAVMRGCDAESPPVRALINSNLWRKFVFPQPLCCSGSVMTPCVGGSMRGDSALSATKQDGR